MRPKTEPPVGLLRRHPAPGPTAHLRFWPSPDLVPYLEHFWTVSWNLEGHPPQRVETVPHPSVQLVFEAGATALGGPHKARFSRDLAGRGMVFGAKFHPASFRGFYGKPLAGLANRTIDPATVFGTDFRRLEGEVLAAPSPEDRVRLVEAYLRRRLPAPDGNPPRLNALLARIVTDRTITQAAQLPAVFGAPLRQIQRLCRDYVGVSPKWIIARYRLHEALARVQGEPEPDWPALALELGYADQAHFIRDFKALVGTTPGAYQAAVSTPMMSPPGAS